MWETHLERKHRWLETSESVIQQVWGNPSVHLFRFSGVQRFLGHRPHWVTRSLSIGCCGLIQRLRRFREQIQVPTVWEVSCTCACMHVCVCVCIVYFFPL